MLTLRVATTAMLALTVCSGVAAKMVTNPCDQIAPPTSDPYAGIAGIRIYNDDTKQKLATADLEAKCLQIKRERLELDRLRRMPTPQPAQARETPEEKARRAYRAEIAKLAAATARKLPRLEQNAKSAFQAAQDLTKHPGFSAAIGMPNPFLGGFGLFDIPATPAGDFRVALQSAVTEDLAPAFDSLKDAGVISEGERDRTLKSLANLGNGMSEEEFKRQLQHYVDRIANGVQISRKQAAMGR